VDFLQCVAKILGRRMSLSFYSKVALTKRPLAKAYNFYKHLALRECPFLSADEK